MKIAFTGASGTGKTTLARAVSNEFGIPLNPVGSRSVAAEMGFANPYDVDAVGIRDEFQRRMIKAKLDWERANPSFVTDRTGMDQLAYLEMESPAWRVDWSYMHERAYMGAVEDCNQQYDLVFFCPIAAFHDTAGDPARREDLGYHQMYEDRLGWISVGAYRRVQIVSQRRLDDRINFVLQTCDNLGLKP